MERYSWGALGARPVFFPAASLALGAWLGSKTLPQSALFLLGAILFGLAALALGHRAGGHVCALLAFLCAGAGLAGWQAAPLVPAGLTPGEPVRLEGVIEQLSRHDDDVQLLLTVARTPDLPAPEARFRASLFANARSLALWPGQRVQVWARLRPEEPPGNPGQSTAYEAHRRRALLFHGSFDPQRLVVLSAAPRWRRWLDRARERLSQRVIELAPSAEAAGLYLALAAGARSELPDEAEEQFARSGLAHVLSVSGLHVAALALLALVALRWMAVRAWPGARTFDVRRWVAPLCVPLLWAYVIFTGNQPPAIRSALMATVVLLGLSLWRRADALNGLCLAALALVTWDPASVADLSLRLSFIAVLSLVLLAPAIRQALPVPRPDPEVPRFFVQKLREAAVQTLCSSAAVTLAGLPLVATAFHRLSLAGLISNIVCMPLCAALTAVAAGGAALFVASPVLATPVLFLGGWASQLLMTLAGLFSAIPGAAIPVRSLGSGAAAAFYAGLLCFSVGRGFWRWGSALVPLALIFAWGLPGLLSRPGMEVTFLSVGQGDAVVVSSQGHHLLVDGGGVPGGGDTGRRFVLPFLREQGIDRLDLTVLSHPHPDHALGLVSTLAAVPTDRLWLAAGTTEGELSNQVQSAARGAAVEAVEAGHPQVQLGEVTVTVLGPPRDRILLEGVNDHSIVLKLQHGAVSVLLTGDIEEAGEEALTPDPVTILKAPHHGSKTSSSPGFVSATRPRFVVFCVGAYNRFHFPNASVVERYGATGARCLRTDVSGAIRFASDGQDVRLETFRAPADG